MFFLSSVFVSPGICSLRSEFWKLQGHTVPTEGYGSRSQSKCRINEGASLAVFVIFQPSLFIEWGDGGGGGRSRSYYGSFYTINRPLCHVVHLCSRGRRCVHRSIFMFALLHLVDNVPCQQISNQGSRVPIMNLIKRISTNRCE